MILFGKDDAHVHAVRILSNAQLTAERYVADAQAYSGRLTQEAHAHRDEIMAQAHQHADVLLEEARTKAREAAVEAMSSEAFPPQTEHERRAAEAELAYLRTFSEVIPAGTSRFTPSRCNGSLTTGTTKSVRGCPAGRSASCSFRALVPATASVDGQQADGYGIAASVTDVIAGASYPIKEE